MFRDDIVVGLPTVQACAGKRRRAVLVTCVLCGVPRETVCRSAGRPARDATHIFVSGFGFSAWVPLVPLAKERLAVDHRVLGLLLLCLGMGSLFAMPLTALSGRATAPGALFL